MTIANSNRVSHQVLGRLATSVNDGAITYANRAVLVTYSGRPCMVYSDDAELYENLISTGGIVMSDGDGNVDFYVPADKDTHTGNYTLQVLADNKSVMHTVTARPIPRMASQLFLPAITPDNRYLGVVPLPSAKTFSGTEETHDIGAVTYKIRRVDATNPEVRGFMAVDVSFTEERQSIEFNRPGMKELDYRVRWVLSDRMATLRETKGALYAFLTASGTVAPFIDVPAPPVGINVAKEWKVNTPFANASGFTYLDVNIEALALENVNNYVPVVVSLPTLAATDPSGIHALRAMAVTNGVVLNNGQQVVTTVRIMKITGAPAPKGSYVWPVTLTDAFGQSATVDLTIEVIED